MVWNETNGTAMSPHVKQYNQVDNPIPSFRKSCTMHGQNTEATKLARISNARVGLSQTPLPDRYYARIMTCLLIALVLHNHRAIQLHLQSQYSGLITFTFPFEDYRLQRDDLGMRLGIGESLRMRLDIVLE